jgi:UDP-N-acetylmuramate-alanine ligase
VTGELVLDAARTAGAPESHYAPDLETLAAGLADELRDADLLVTMGAGNIDEVSRAVLARLRGEA